jgi:alkanesulfonate monooxygenase SsuD/methylene tetrahydromethanopterin reductase-like flavin-dependent oxidoreductase (luciferase family)
LPYPLSSRHFKPEVAVRTYAEHLDAWGLIEFAARNDIRITPGLAPDELQDDVIAYYTRCLAANGVRITPDRLSVGVSAYVADSEEAAIRECGPYLLYFNRTLFSHGNFTETAMQRETGFSARSSTDYVRAENLRAAEFNRGDFRNMTMADMEKMADTPAPARCR